MDDERVEEEKHLLSSGRLTRRRGRHRVYCLAVAIAVTALFCLGLGLGLGLWYGGIDESHGGSSSDSSSGTYQRAAVATDAAQCSTVGVEVLKRNGNAVDAAIASLLCVGVINFHSTGISGGGFMVYYNATSKTATTLDYRETAPGRANSSMYARFGPNENASLFGKRFSTGALLLIFHTVYRRSRYCGTCRVEGVGAGSPEVWKVAVE